MIQKNSACDHSEWIGPIHLLYYIYPLKYHIKNWKKLNTNKTKFQRNPRKVSFHNAKHPTDWIIMKFSYSNLARQHEVMARISFKMQNIQLCLCQGIDYNAWEHDSEQNDLEDIKLTEVALSKISLSISSSMFSAFWGSENRSPCWWLSSPASANGQKYKDWADELYIHTYIYMFSSAGMWQDSRK